MPRKSKKLKVKFISDSNALHIKKINGIPVQRTHIKMNLSPERLHVSSCKNGNFKSQNFKNPAEFMKKLQNHNMSIHETLAPLGKNKKTNFYHKSKPIFQGLPPIIRIQKPTRKLTPYPKKPTKKPIKKPTKKPTKKLIKTKTDKKKIFERLAQSLKQLEKTM